jgi:UDP:flavonoid glycosyltransferase YjiC (YdhE family)
LARFADIITLTLIGKIWSSVKALLIPDFPEPYTISIGNLTIPKSYRKNVKLIGPILPQHPKQLPTKEKLCERLELPKNKPIVFVPMSGPTSEKAFIIEIIRNVFLDFSDEYEIVMSYGIPNTDSKPMRHGNLTIYKWIPNRFEYLKACDVVIGRAGHGTITQSMCYGKPMVLIPTPGHTEQINNARQAENIGVAKIALQNFLSKQKMLEKVRGALSSEMVRRAEQVQEEALKHDGLENAVKEILQAAQK